jgi:hypothetical protein
LLFDVWAPCEEKINFFFNSFFGTSNYIFRKLSNNTKHVKFQPLLSVWCIFVPKLVIDSFFLVFFEEILYAKYMAKTAQGLKVICYKLSLFCPWNLGFFFFFLFMVLHDVIFNVTTWIETFQKSLQVLELYSNFY